MNYFTWFTEYANIQLNALQQLLQENVIRFSLYNNKKTTTNKQKKQQILHSDRFYEICQITVLLTINSFNDVLVIKYGIICLPQLPISGFLNIFNRTQSSVYHKIDSDCNVNQMIEQSRVFICTSNFIQIIFKVVFYYSHNNINKSRK